MSLLDGIAKSQTIKMIKIMYKDGLQFNQFSFKYVQMLKLKKAKKERFAFLCFKFILAFTWLRHCSLLNKIQNILKTNIVN